MDEKCVYCLNHFKRIFEMCESCLVPFELNCCRKLVHACCLIVYIGNNCKECKIKICDRDLELANERPVSKMPERFKRNNPKLMEYWKFKKAWCIIKDDEKYCDCCVDKKNHFFTCENI